MRFRHLSKMKTVLRGSVLKSQDETITVQTGRCFAVRLDGDASCYMTRECV
jgi:hypothetical protein